MSDSPADPEKYINKFEALLINPKPGTSHSKLWYEWHFLQVYSHWGLQLPHTEAALKLQLRTNEPGSYGFFASAVEAYGSVHTACTHFLEEVFPGVVGLGTALREFAKDATGKEGLLWTAIDLLDDKESGIDAALQLLFNLRTQANENSEKAKAVGKQLAGFQGKLITAHGQLEATDKKVEEDNKTSQATIDRLMSKDEKAKNSLASIKKFVEESSAKYEQYVIIASTTPTYAWVVIPFPPIPIGPIAAIIVAGIYGNAARNELILLRGYQDDLKKMEAELATALTAHGVQEAAHRQLSGAQTHTKTAIDYTANLQNAWQGLADDIGSIHTYVKNMTVARGDEVILAAKRTMEVYAKRAEQAWGRILPPLNDLADKPYITIKSGQATFETMLNDPDLGS